MLTFKSHCEIDNVQHLYPDQYHWEARSAHIFNHLWRDVTARLPLPDIDQVPYNPVVAVCIGDMENQIRNVKVEMADDSMDSLGMITMNYMDLNTKRYECSVHMRDDNESRWKNLDLDIFKHELIHCYQWLWHIKKQFDHCEQRNWDLFGDENRTYLQQEADQHNSLIDQHTDWLEAQKPIRDARRDSLTPQMQNFSIDDRLTKFVLPVLFDDNNLDMNHYCDIIKDEGDMCIQAGKVWTPELSYSENLVLYQNVFTNTFRSVRNFYQKLTGQAGTRQQLTKLNIVPQLVAHCEASPKLAPMLKFKAHTFLKDRYNYIENAELQLAD